MTEIVKFVNTIIVESAVTSETIVSGMQGPPGATGPQGPAGIAGTAGAQGPQGTPGAVLVNLANSVQVPVGLTAGQALYNYAVGASTDYGDRLFIGVPSGSGVTGVLVGGKYYTDLLDTATSLASAGMLVKRDNTGKLTGDITGNSATAAKLTTARSISIAGDIVTSAVNFDGSSNIQLSAALATQTGLTTGTYGSTTLVPVITVNSKGVITAISTQTIAGSGGSGTLLLGADINSSGSVASGGTLQILGGTGITTGASGNSITIGINSNVATTSGTQTLTNKTISTNSTWTGNTISQSRGGTGSTTGSIVTDDNLTFSSGGTLYLNAQTIDVGGSSLTNLTTPQQDSDAATKAYVDTIQQGLDIKESVKVATTTNITLYGQQSIDGVSVLSGDRILVKNQTNASENGIWYVYTQAWYRAEDADTSDKVTAGLFTFVEQGTQNAGNGFVLTTSNPIVLDVTGLTFSQFSGGGTLLVGSGLTKTGNTISAVFSGSYTDLTNKPVIPAAQVQSDWNAVSGLGVILNKPALFSGSYSDLTNKPVLFSGSYTDLTNKPAIPAAQVQSDWAATVGLGVILNKPALFSGSYSDLTNKPALFSGSYSDLTNKPTIPDAQVQSDWNAVSGLGVILNKPALFSGSYSDLTNKPVIPAAQVQTDWNATTGLGAILNKPNFATVATSGSYSDLTGTVPTWNQNTTGNAATATNVAYSGLTGTVPTWNQNTTGTAAALTTPRAINGVNFDGSTAITITAAAGTLSGNTLASGITASSLTSVGTIATGVWNGSSISTAYTDAKVTSVNGSTGAVTGLATTASLSSYQTTSEKNAANGYVGLDSSAKISSTYLPSYVDDVIEAANQAALPATGETGKIYVTLDTNKTYRWSGSAYVEISPSPGSTDAVTEGTTNKYYTDARARAALSFSQNLSYNSATGTVTGPDLSSYLTSVTPSNFASQTAKFVLAAPNAANGTPVFRALIASDIPVLNQDTTGNAATATNVAYSGLTGTIPTWNQNTTGSAATLTTARAIYGNNFDGSAALTQIIASSYGGTGNGFTKFSGPTTAEKTFTLPNASATILTSNAAVTIAQGGTGQTTASDAFNALSPITTTGDLILGSGTNTATRLAIGANTYVLTSNGTTASWQPAASGGGGGGTTTNALTIGTGLSGTSFNGSSAVTIAIDSTVATLTGTQTLTNKTLTSPTINSATANNLTFTGTLTAGGGVGTNGQVLTSTSTGVEWATGLTASGVTAGVYVNPTVTVNTYGQVTAASSGMDIMTAAFIFGG